MSKYFMNDFTKGGIQEQFIKQSELGGEHDSINNRKKTNLLTNEMNSVCRTQKY